MVFYFSICVQVEYDNLLLRAMQCIFASETLGAWQFLAIIPYNVSSVQILWQSYYLLHNEYQKGIIRADYKTGNDKMFTDQKIMLEL
jgi:hypothetical protein